MFKDNNPDAVLRREKAPTNASHWIKNPFEVAWDETPVQQNTQPNNPTMDYEIEHLEMRNHSEMCLAMPPENDGKDAPAHMMLDKVIPVSPACACVALGLFTE